MSYFTEGEPNPSPTTEAAPQPNQTVDYVGQVVQAKGDQWSDPQAVAKGYLASQEYITNLENQAKEMQTELGKQDYAKNLLSKLQEQGKPPAEEQPVVTGSVTEENTTPTRSDDELKNLMKEVLTQTKTEDIKTSNLRVVDEKLSELYGTEAEATMLKKSRDLGLSKERLGELAGESPAAFFRLIGEEAPAKETNKTTQGTINTTASSFDQTSAKRDWAYYENIRKTDKALYFSPKVQNQLFQDKMEQGANFGNS